MIDRIISPGTIAPQTQISTQRFHYKSNNHLQYHLNLPHRCKCIQRPRRRTAVRLLPLPRILHRFGVRSGAFWPFWSAVLFNTSVQHHANLLRQVWKNVHAFLYHVLAAHSPVHDAYGVAHSAINRMCVILGAIDPATKDWTKECHRYGSTQFSHTECNDAVLCCWTEVTTLPILQSPGITQDYSHVTIVFDAVSAATPPSRASMKPIPTQQDSLFLKIPLPIGPSWRPHLLLASQMHCRCRRTATV